MKGTTMVRGLSAAFLILAVASATAPARDPDDVSSVFADTVIHVQVVKVGAKVERMHVTDAADTRMFLTVGEPLFAGQRIAYSVFGKADYRFTFWGGEGQLAVRRREAIDEALGQGWRLTYADGTVVEIVS